LVRWCLFLTGWFSQGREFLSFVFEVSGGERSECGLPERDEELNASDGERALIFAKHRELSSFLRERSEHRLLPERQWRI
jgi:hypothetical protein